MESDSCTIITIKLNGIIQSVDKNCSKLFGYTLEELVGNTINKIIPHPYKTQHDTFLENYRRTKIPKIIGKSRIVEGQHKDGSVFPIKISVSKVDNCGGESFVSQTTNCGSSSTQGCPVLSHTSSSNNNNSNDDDMLFVGIVDKLEDSAGLITVDPKGTIVACNANVKDIFGYHPDELKGNNIKMLVPSPHQEKHDGYLKTLLEGGNPRVLGHTRNVPALHKHGNVFPISLHVEAVPVGPITLFRVEKVNELEAVFVIDKDGKIASCNHNFVQPLFGYSSSQLVGQNFSMLIPHMSQKTITVPKLQDSEERDSEERDSKRPRLTKEDSWRVPGIHKEEVQHKDGSVFPVILDIHTFQEFGEGTIRMKMLSLSNTGKEMYSATIRRADSSDKKRHSEKMIGDYYVTKTLGRGSFGKVTLAHHKDSTDPVAIKTLQKSSMSALDMERAKREIKIVESLDHPNIIKFHEVLETDNHIHIVMEYGGRTLLSYIHERNGLGELEAKKFFIQILKAVEYCHSKNIIHRDIKHQNILLTDQSVCKLIDFGLSRYVEEGVATSSYCGTPAYASPQMLLGKQYSGQDLDIWVSQEHTTANLNQSLGVVLYSMITGTFPFENIEDILKGSLKRPQNISDDCFELLQWMLQVDTAKRATLKQVMSHKWITG